jgi:hypothetical protein
VEIDIAIHQKAHKQCYWTESSGALPGHKGLFVGHGEKAWRHPLCDAGRRGRVTKRFWTLILDIFGHSSSFRKMYRKKKKRKQNEQSHAQAILVLFLFG